MMEKVTVDAAPLLEILQALNGPSFLIRELQAIRSVCPDNPIDTLIGQFNAQAMADEKGTSP